MSKIKEKIKRIFFSIIILILIFLLVFFIWVLFPSKPHEIALRYLNSDDYVNIINKKDYIIFEPKNTNPKAAFIFYPGGHVDFRAYSPILYMISKESILVVLLRVNLNLAFFDINSADRFFKKDYSKYSSIKIWVIGGHSLGGVAAAFYASKNDLFKGIIFWASYTANDSLKDKNIKMLSIYGTEDGGLDNGRKIEEHKKFMSKDSYFYIINGGNHAQFADYGNQPGDKPAKITQEEQIEEVKRETIKFIEILIND